MIRVGLVVWGFVRHGFVRKGFFPERLLPERSVRGNNVVFEALAAKMHVREKAKQGSVVGQGAMDLDPVIVGGRRNRNGVVVIG